MGSKAQKAKQVKLPNGEIGIEYYDADGNKIATNAGGFKPWRNNNPGNLKGGVGAIGYDEKGFAIFPDMETGLKAKADLLRNDQRYKDLTIKEMIPVYAPASDNNNVPGYTKDIGNFSGLDVNRRLDSLSAEEYQRLMQAMSRREGAIDKHGNPIGVGTATDHTKETGAKVSPLQPNPPPAPTPQPTLEPTPVPVTTAPPAPEPDPTPAPAPEQKRSEAPADPQVAVMVEMAAKPVDNPGRSALLKSVENLTQPEMMDMINHAQGDYRGWRSGDPLKYHTYEKVQDWHAAMYGDGPQQYDGGKPIEPIPIRPIPEQISPHTTPNGEDLWQATARIGSKVADAAGSDGYANSVTGLQRGLNMLMQNPYGLLSDVGSIWNRILGGIYPGMIHFCGSQCLGDSTTGSVMIRRPSTVAEPAIQAQQEQAHQAAYGQALFRASYLAKNFSKGSTPHRVREFGCSQL